jgi:hypothetical protein
MDWWHGSRCRVPALQVWTFEFKSQFHKKSFNCLWQNALAYCLVYHGSVLWILYSFQHSLVDNEIAVLWVHSEPIKVSVYSSLIMVWIKFLSHKEFIFAWQSLWWTDFRVSRHWFPSSSIAMCLHLTLSYKFAAVLRRISRGSYFICQVVLGKIISCNNKKGNHYQPNTW